MKKIIVILMMVGLLAGCATDSWFCKNKESILTGVSAVMGQADAVIAMVESAYPNAIPDYVKAVLAGAQAVRAGAVFISAKVCPTVDDLTTLQNDMKNVTLMAQNAGLKLRK